MRHRTDTSAHVRTHRIRTLAQTLVAAGVALAVGLSQASLAAADTSTNPNDTPMTPATGVSTMGPGETYIPMVDTEVGKWPKAADGAAPVRSFHTAGADVSVPLELAAEGTPAETDPQDAVVRVTVLTAPGSPGSAPTQVLAGGDAFLSVPAGESRSTMVVMPVQNKAIALHTTTETNLRIEKMATFSTKTGTPGGLQAVDQPVVRADAAVGTSAPQLRAVPGETEPGMLGASAPTSGLGGSLTFGVTGQGGVPSAGVRSVSLSIRLQSNVGQTVTVAGQRLQTSPGEDVLNVFADPDAQGNVTIETEQPASVRAAVRGWVDNGGQNAETLNAGSGLMSLGAAAVRSDEPGDGQPRSYHIEAGDAQAIDLTGAPSDAAFAFVQADVTGVTTRSQLEVGDFYLGRGRGLAVQPQRTESELMIVPVVGGVITMREGAADVTLTVRQYVLRDHDGSDVRPDENDRMLITSPDNGSTQHLEHSATFTMQGLYTQGQSSLDRIEIHARKASGGAPSLVATAEVAPDPDHPETLAWQAEVSAPQGGDYVFTAVGKDADGTLATQEITLHIELQIDTSTPMVSNDAWVLRSGTFVKAEDALAAPDQTGGTPGNGLLEENPSSSSAQIDEVQADSVLVTDQPPFAPGDVFVTGSIDAEQSGVLRTVQSIDRTPQGWRVHTADAALTDVFQQVDVAQQTDTAPLVDPAKVKAETASQPAADSDPVTIERPASGEGVQPLQVVPSVDVSSGRQGHETTDCTVTENVDDDLTGRQDQTAPVCPESSDGHGSLSDAGVGAHVEQGFKATVQLAWDTKKDPFGGDVLVDDVKDISQLAPQERASREAKTAFDGGVSLGFTGEMTLGVDVGLKVGLRWGWVPKPFVKDLHAIIENQTKVSYSLKAWLKASASAKAKYRLVKLPISAITVMAGPVPVIFKPYVNVNVGAQISLTGSLIMSGSTTTKSRYGFTYANGKVTKVAVTEKSGDPVKATSSGVTMTKSVKIDASAGPSLEAGVLLYGALGLQAELSLAAGATAQGAWEQGVVDGQSFNRLKYSASAYLAAGAQGSAEIRIPVVDFRLKSFLLVEFSRRLDIWHGEGKIDVPQ